MKRLEHNRKLMEEYVASSGVHCRFSKVSEQVDCIPLQRDKLKPFGYNPSIIEHDGRMFMAYRYHQGTPSTKLAMAEIKETGEVVSGWPLVMDGRSIEDPKLFPHNGHVFMSWVEASYPELPLRSVVKWGLYAHLDGHIVSPTQIQFGRNDWTALEKSWVMFEHEGNAWFIYQSSPEQMVVRVDTLEPQVSPGPKWAYGTIKGGTAPVPYEDKLLRFFHSTLDNDPGEWYRRYFIGAMLMENRPPFAVTHVSKTPIIYGNETGFVKRNDCEHFKGNVVFPSGVIARDWGWLLSLGENDSSCVIAKVTPKELNL